MKILELLRREQSRQGTIGILSIDKEVFCFTLEPPDRLNERNRSSIPTGQYICIPYKSPQHGDTWMIQDVPNRDFILFHAGNIVQHTSGCIIVGQTIGKLRGNRAVLNSGKTFACFLDKMSGQHVAHLTIEARY